MTFSIDTILTEVFFNYKLNKYNQNLLMEILSQTVCNRNISIAVTIPIVIYVTFSMNLFKSQFFKNVLYH